MFTGSYEPRISLMSRVRRTGNTHFWPLNTRLR